VAIRTRQFYNAVVPTGAGVKTLDTVPPGYRALLKWWSVFNGDAVARSVTLFVATGSSGGILWSHGTMPAQSLERASGYAVGEPGDSFAAVITPNLTALVNVHLGGILFEL
jgi:hypothetical protein